MQFIHHSWLKGEIAYFLIVLTLVFSFGCFHEFYKAKPANLETFKETVNTGKIQKAKYYVIHQGSKAMHLADISFQNNNIQGVLSDLPPHRIQDPKPDNQVTRYRPTEKYILQEVHLFLKDEAPILLDTGDVEISLVAIDKIQIYDKATGETIASHVLGVVGLTAGILAAVSGIKVAEEGIWGGINVPTDANGEYTSCPYVYANDGQTFRLQGEIFAGAIFPKLERHDYLPLPDIQVVDESYQIRISNEQKELQHINLAELAVVELPLNSDVLLDQQGAIQTINAPNAPVMAQAPNGKDLLPLLLQKDQQAYYFEEGDELQNYVKMRFVKPEQAATGKLLLNIKESYWATFMMGAYFQKLGSGYEQWAAQLAEQPPQAITKILDDQGLHLGVYLWTEGQWQLVETINNTGPIAFRDIVIPLDLSGLQGDEVRVKVAGGHLFWEVDYAAMDFTENLEVYYHAVQPGFAKASDGYTYTDALAKDDNQYLHQTYDGNQVTVWYPAIPERPGYQQSVFLHSKGYYQAIMDYTGAPDLPGLPALDQPGSFIEFSNARFQDYLEANRLK